jgi:DNA repair protein RecO (recombination protein O)
MAYFQRENRELVNLDGCELIRSQFNLVADYSASVALDFLAEVSEQLLPAAEPSEKFFRLLVAVLDSLPAPGGVWRGVTYFALWAVRLSGWLPELHVCLSCGSVLNDPDAPERAFFSRGQAGLICNHCRRALSVGGSWELSRDSMDIVQEMLRQPVAKLSRTAWSQSTAADLRRFLVQQIETHAERRMLTYPVLESSVEQTA